VPYVKFEVLTAVKVMLFWDVTPCKLAGGYLCFRGKYFLSIFRAGDSIFFRKVGICL
jgi:hypothetical protein